jgi:hypothetical protein
MAEPVSDLEATFVITYPKEGFSTADDVCFACVGPRDHSEFVVIDEVVVDECLESIAEGEETRTERRRLVHRLPPDSTFDRSRIRLLPIDPETGDVDTACRSAQISEVAMRERAADGSIVALPEAAADRLTSELFRDAWFPVVGDGVGSPRGSHFGGSPLIEPDGARPRCPECHAPLVLLIQIDLGASPLLAEGTLQVFHCENGCDPELADTRSPFLRWFEPGEGAVLAPSSGYPELSIEGWEPARELPHPEEPGLGEVSDDERQAIDAMEHVFAEDKLGGWPCWQQEGLDIDIACPTCSDELEQREEQGDDGVEAFAAECAAANLRTFAFQIASDRNLPESFSTDSGAGFVFLCRCTRHGEKVAYIVWQGT